MRIKIKINNDDTLNLNKRWIRNIFLIFGLVFTSVALTQIFCIAIKPKGYENIIFTLGGKYIRQLCFGIIFLITYYGIKNSNPINVK